MSKLSLFCVLTVVLVSLQLALSSKHDLNGEDLIWTRGSKVRRSAALPPPLPGQVQMGCRGQFPRSFLNEQELSNLKRRSGLQSDSFPTLKHYFMNESHSDIKLVVNGTKLPAHKFVLAAKSGNFSEMFGENPTKQEFALEVDNENEFKTVLKYFYTEKYDPIEDRANFRKVLECYKLARDFQVFGLMRQIKRSMAKVVSIDNYLEVYGFAEQNKLHELVRLWMRFVFGNSQQIIEYESYLNASPDVVQLVLCALNVNLSYVVKQIQKVSQSNPQLDLQMFKPTIDLQRCTIDDLLALHDMKIIDHNLLIEELFKRVRSLQVNCKLPIDHKPNSPMDSFCSQYPKNCHW